MIKRIRLILLLVAISIVLGIVADQAEDKLTGENAEKVGDSIETYVKQDSSLKGGFLIYDEKEEKLLNLKYDHVHKGVKKTESGQYFACVDFVDENKNTYDLDFYVDKEGENLYISNIVIHKINGKDRLKE